METLTKIKRKEQITPEDTSHAALIHLSSLASFLIPLGSILGPFITWMIWRDQSEFVDDNGKQAMNFNISFTLYNVLILVVGVIMFLTPILVALENNGGNPAAVLLSLPGLWLLLGGFGLLGIVRLILMIIASVKAGNGELYHYPLTIQFIK